MSRSSRRHRIPSLVVAACLLVAGCASQPAPNPAATSPAPSPTPIASATASSAAPTSAASATPTTGGFAFAAADVVAYYVGQGYACTAQAPSSEAVGFFFRTCQKADEAGRTLVIGVVTDPAGAPANGFASVQGTEAEDFLAPIDALEPLAGFLGAMLGEEQGAALLPWLAGHLGDVFAETTVGALTVATYSESEDDRSKLYVEVANRAYLDAPGVEIP